MKISIRQRLAPYSHASGAHCVIPGTCVVVEMLSNLLRVGALEIHLPPGKRTLQQDLMRNCVWVFGEKWRAKVTAGGVAMRHRGGEMKIFPMEHASVLPQEWERLSLGSHRAQDWDLMLYRFDPKEILPVLFGLSQKMPDFASRVIYHQIRALFVREEEKTLHLLPSCPFDAGRMTNLQTKWGSLDIEWTQKSLQRMVFRPRRTDAFLLSANIHSFRVKTSGHEKGSIYSAAEPFPIEAGKVYFFDRMMKKGIAQQSTMPTMRSSS